MGSFSKTITHLEDVFLPSRDLNLKIKEKKVIDRAATESRPPLKKNF
jgi:hypothetical protein